MFPWTLPAHRESERSERYEDSEVVFVQMLTLSVVAAMLVVLWPVLPPAAADSVLTKIHVDQPTAMAVNPKTNQIYVTSADNNTLTVIDGTTDTVSRVIPVGLDPRRWRSIRPPA